VTPRRHVATILPKELTVIGSILAATRLVARGLLASVLLASALESQEATAPGPRARTWGAEASVGDGMGGTLLRFRSPTSAWTLGVSGHLGVFDEDRPGIEESGVTYNVSLRTGIRRYRAAAAALSRRTRPIAGVGVLGGVARNDFSRSWSAGLFGEVGAVHFFSPHVSLGASGGLELRYTEQKFATGLGDARQSQTTLSVGLVRVLGAVYF
jgi:hypothetical protein